MGSNSINARSATLRSLTLLLCILGYSASAAPMKFGGGFNGGNCGTPCGWLTAEGEITADTPKEFRKFMTGGSSPGGLLVINSPGGSVVAAMELGRMFRREGLLLTVGKTVDDPSSPGTQEIKGGSCLSACAIAFMGGTQRYVDDGVARTPRPWWRWDVSKSEIGVHQFYVDRGVAEARKLSRAIDELSTGLSVAQVLTGALIAYAVEMGVDPRVITLASETDAKSMRVLSHSEAVALKLINAPDPTPSWSLNAQRGALVASARGRIDVREYEMKIYCVRQKRGMQSPLLWQLSYRPGGLGNETDPGKELRELLKPSWSVQLNVNQEAEVAAPLVQAGFAGGVTTVTLLLNDKAANVLKAGGSLKFQSGLPRARGHLVIPATIAMPEATAILPLLQKNCQSS